MALDDDRQKDSLVDDSANSAQSMRSAYNTAHDAYDKGKKLYNYIKDKNNTPAHNNAGDANSNAVKNGMENTAKNTAKNGAENIAQKAGEEVGKQAVNKAVETTATTAGVASGAVTFGVGTAITTAVQAVKKAKEAVDKVNDKEKKGGGKVIITIIVVIIVLLLLPVFLVLCTPTMILVAFINVLMGFLADIGADFWVELGNQIGIVSEENYDAFKVETIIDKYDIDDAEENGISVQTAVVLDLSKDLLRKTYNDLVYEIEFKCSMGDEYGYAYNWDLTNDSIASFDSLYGKDKVNYAEIACIASQSPKYADALTYSDFQNHIKNKNKRENLIVYESKPVYSINTVEEYINMYGIKLWSYEGIIQSNGEVCTITYEKRDNDAWRDECCIANCKAQGYQYIIHHSVTHGNEESSETAGYYCINHEPASLTHSSEGVSATTQDLEIDISKYKSPPWNEIKPIIDELYGSTQQEISDEIKYGSYMQVEEGLYVSTTCYELDLSDETNLTKPKEEKKTTTSKPATEETSSTSTKEEEKVEVEKGRVISDYMIQTAISEYRKIIGSKQYTIQYLEITAYPYSLREMYAFFDSSRIVSDKPFSPLTSNTTYPQMTNYDALDAKENWLRNYASEIADELGKNERTLLVNNYKYTGDLNTGDIFMEDIILTEAEVRINLPSYYNQGDARWASLPFWVDETIGKSGCCLCAMAMIADYYTPDIDVTPITLQSYGSPIMDEQLKFYRGGVTQEFDFELVLNERPFDSKTCMEHLQQGNLILVHYYAGSEFTKRGHFAVIHGYKYNENGEAIFLTYDSGSKTRTETGVTFAQVEFNSDAMWVYGKDGYNFLDNAELMGNYFENNEE